MAAAIDRIRRRRRAWFERRESLRDGVRGLTLESWIEANLEAARRLARPDAAGREDAA